MMGHSITTMPQLLRFIEARPQMPADEVAQLISAATCTYYEGEAITSGEVLQQFIKLVTDHPHPQELPLFYD